MKKKYLFPEMTAINLEMRSSLLDISEDDLIHVPVIDEPGDPGDALTNRRMWEDDDF